MVTVFFFFSIKTLIIVLIKSLLSLIGGNFIIPDDEQIILPIFTAVSFYKVRIKIENIFKI